MDFRTLTDTQIELCKLASDFAKKEIQPVAALLDKQAAFPAELHKKAMALGILNLLIPEDYGGLGLGNLDFIMVTERLAWGCSGVAGALSLNSMVGDCILLGGTEKQKEKYLGKIVNGEIGSYALTEPHAGSNVAAIKTAALKKGSKYILNGSKTWISNSPVASFFIVFAKTDPDAAHKGISAFIIDRDTPGLEVGKDLEKLGQKAFPAAEVFFQNVELSAEHLLGKEGEGFLLAMKIFDRSRPMVAASGVGLSKRCLDESLLYAKSRETMGKAIINHQMIAAKIADMGMRHEASRLLTYQAADLLDRNLPNTIEASYAKTFAADTAAWASSEAVQVFGGMGYSKEYPVEKLYRDSKVLQIYEGTNEIQRLIMARELSK
ncbi:MAG: acyl-CoA dehydrogenase family protein [Bacteriovorax sp.]|jgi:acyl-CoA dehydrogenase